MRNMMGLLGNVAEVQELRSGLMQYVRVFYDLLDSFLDGIEVSYLADFEITNFFGFCNSVFSTTFSRFRRLATMPLASYRTSHPTVLLLGSARRLNASMCCVRW